MRIQRIVIFLIAFSIAGAFCQAQKTVDPGMIDGLFRILENHSWDKSYDTLRYIDEAVTISTRDEQLRENLESRFVKILETSENIFALQYACRQLYLIGTVKAVPAIEPWLVNEEISHMARYALRNIDDPMADMALRDALGKTEGNIKAGIITSLGERKDLAILPDLVILAEDKDKVIAVSAINALGNLGSADALGALEKAAMRSETFYTEATNARIKITENLLAEGKPDIAETIYKDLYLNGQTPNFRMAGLKGMMAVPGSKNEKLLVDALKNENPEIRGFAGRLISNSDYQVEVGVLLKSLKKLPPEGKIVLVDALGSRKAAEAKSSILKLGDSPEEELQVAVVRAIGHIGSEEDILFLAGKATSDSRKVANAAEVSLSQLEGKNINQSIIAYLGSSGPAVQAVLITSLTNRFAREGKDEVVSHLQHQDAAVRKAVLEYTRQLGGVDELQMLIDFIDQSPSRSEKRLASRAVTSICTAHGEAAEEIIISNLDGANNELAEILVETLSLIHTPAALEKTIEYTKDADPDIQKTAVRTLSSWPDSTAMDDLKEIMNNNPDRSQRILAFRGYFRLYRNTHIAENDKMREYGRLIQNAERKEEKILVLSAFQDIRTINAMKRIEKYLYDEDMAEETCATILRISDFLDKKYKSDVAIAMMQIMKVTDDENILEDVQRRFDRFDIDPDLYFDDPTLAKEPGEKRIVFISGPMDHAWYNAHEYPKDLLFIKKCMENSPDLEGIQIDFYLTDEVIDLSLIRGADAIVAHSSADRARGEVHSLFPNNREDMNYTEEEKQYFEKLDKMVKQGMGVVTLHYSVWTDFPESRKYMTDWVGGFYDNDVSRVRMDSVPVKLDTPSHQINNGVNPWFLREEYYINQVYNKKGMKFTSLLSAELPLNRGDEAVFHTVGWAVERKDGGRGFGYTGIHTHSHLYHEDYRKFVVNAIAWTAGYNIPKNGIKTEMPEGW